MVFTLSLNPIFGKRYLACVLSSNGLRYVAFGDGRALPLIAAFSGAGGSAQETNKICGTEIVTPEHRV